MYRNIFIIKRRRLYALHIEFGGLALAKPRNYSEFLGKMWNLQ